MKKRLSFLFLVLIVVNATIAQSWERIQLASPFPNNTPILFDGVCFNDSCVVAESSGCFFRSNDFFQSFTIDSSHKGALLHALSFANRQIGYATSTFANGGMFKTVDGGISWNELPSGNSVNSPGNVLFFTKPDTGYVAYSSTNGRFRTTWNGGVYWSNPPILNFECPSILRIQFTNDSTGYILSSDNPSLPTGFGEFRIFKSNDYGNNWQNITHLHFPEYPMGFGDFKFINDTTCILVANQTILKSTNAALSFDTVMSSLDAYNDGFNASIPAISFANPDTGYIAFAGSVYKTCNAGSLWSKTDFHFEDSDINNSIWFLQASTSEKVIVGCQKGSIYITETGGGVWSGIKDVIAENTFTISPNPATSHLTITQNATIPNTTIQLLSIESKTLTGAIPLTSTNQQIDISFLPIGIYLAVLQNNEQRVVRRFVKE